MQEIIEQILDGNFEYENGVLDFSCSKLEITIQAGECYEGSFQVSAPAGTLTTGYITTSDYRMECLCPEVKGSIDDVPFCFHGEYMEEGDVVKGSIDFISNHGEYHLPFVVTVEHSTLNSSIGTIKNLFHFANLAKSNWNEAVNLFYSPEFERVFSGTDSKMYDCYRGLSANKGNEQNVEEFLIHINKKQRVEYIQNEQELSLELPLCENPDQVLELELNIVRNGWGYTALNIECDGEFVFTEKTFLTDDDFLGNRCRIPVFINSSQCRPGKNFGRVVLFNSYVCLNIPVEVNVGDHLKSNRAVISKQRLITQMMEYYQAFRMKKISSSTWRKETAALVEKQILLDENDIAARLFQAQILISEDRYNEAEWILDHAEALLEKNYDDDDTLHAYYLYLTTLIHREEDYVNRVTNQVRRMHRNDYTNWRVAWLLLYLSEEYNKSASSKWMYIEEQYYYGCCSPIFYAEALILLCNNPSLLRKLEEFELQVLNYGTKHQVISAALMEQIVYICGRNREYSGILLKILIAIYEMKKDSRVLQEICTLLIKGSITDSKYFKWYELGVEQQLRITNLYEYYMMSLDLSSQKPLPKVLIMYFSYQNNLDYEHSAYLYDYLIRHKNEMPELYATYEARIQRFALEQISKMHINRNLASIYQAILTPEMINEENIKELSRLLFANLIRVEDYRIKKAIVYQPNNLNPREYQFKDFTTWVSLYGNDFTIVFEDGFGNRFIDNVEYTLEKLMIPGKFLRTISKFCGVCPELDLYLVTEEQSDLSDECIARYMNVAKTESVTDKLRRELYIKILQHYYDEDDMRALDEYLEQIPFDELNMADRERVIKFMVFRGKYDIAYNWVALYGPYFVDSKTLLRLTSQKIQENNFVEDEILTASALYVFQKGKYDSIIITYLAAYYNGTVKEMRQIWKAARAFDVDCYKLSERIIIQMLYSGAFVGEKMDIFRYYVSQGAKQEVEQAFLTQCSYDYFVKEKLTEEYVFEEIRLAHQRGEEIKFVCKLAFLKYYSEYGQDLDDDKLFTVREFMIQMLDDDIHFNFFREYAQLSDLTKTFADRTIIEYRAKPGNRCRIHYVRVRENGESDEYLSEYMDEVFAGVCFKEFILFFGESIQYYITEEKGADEQLTESGNLQRSDINAEVGTNKYSLINDIVISKTLQDYDTLNDLLTDYYKKEYYNEKLFELK